MEDRVPIENVESMLREQWSEKDFARTVVTIAHALGWQVYSVIDSRHPAKRTLAGYPDLTMWRGRRLIFAELKSQKGKLTQMQATILDELKGTGVECYVWRPSDFDSLIATLSHHPDAQTTIRIDE